ncbi:hypothetical protein BB560_002156 [Smittium megazygosporum]|uniref:Uncharacterized protein n=1 Tax=Smittium megazygosporum TaxID=133381 RepID=A0A2T9ZFJ5_9FUNG|nr:hypothetical protein BB560_002156 [Smittium megazygosporum]
MILDSHRICPVTETATIGKSPIKLTYYWLNYVQSDNVYSSNPFTLSGCSSGYFYMTFNVNYTAVEPKLFSVALENGTKVTSYPILFENSWECGTVNYFILHDRKRSKIGANGLNFNYLNTPSTLNKIIYDKGTKAYLVDEKRGSANINNIQVKCLANDTCLTIPQAPYSSPSSDDGGDGGAPSGVDSSRNAAPTITVSTTIFSTITQSTTASTTVIQTVSPSIIPTVTTTATTTAIITATTTATAAAENRGTVTTTVSATCADKQLPTNQVATNSLTVKSLKANKNYSENEKINIPCSGDFTLSLTSNSRDSDLFFGFSDANGISKDAKFVELQIGLKNGQNTIKDLVTAKVKRSNLVKRQGSAKINLIYVNGIYSLLSNGQGLTTFKGSNITPKSLTITPFDGTVTLANFVLTCM